MIAIDTTIKHDFEIYYREDNYWEVPHHAHDHYELIFVVGGSANLVVDKKSYSVKPGSLLIINRFEDHDIEITQYPYCRYVLSMTHLFSMNTIKDEVLLSLLFQRPDDFIHMISLEDEDFARIRGIFDELCREYATSRDYDNLCIESLLNLLFVTLYRASAESFPIQKTSNIVNVVVDIQRYVSANFREGIQLDTLESKYFLSKYYICHKFKEITGYTLKDYITRQRLLHAKELLTGTDKPIVKIAEECGYNSVNHFSRIFLQREQMSPTTYRKQSRTAPKN